MNIRPASEFSKGEPGIYEGVPENEYHAFPAVSQSALKQYYECPAKYKWELDHPRKQTSGMKKGSATHALVLEPQEFLKKYVTAKQCEATTNADKQCSKGGQVFQGGKWLCSTHGDKEAGNDDDRTVLNDTEFQETKWMRDKIWGHPAASKLLSMPAYRELTCLWVDEETGLLCKSRLDTVLKKNAWVIDVKTTRDASPDGFAKEIANLKMYWQAAWYPAGLHNNGVKTSKWIWIACENSAPFECAVYEADPLDIDAGWTEIRPTVSAFAKSKETGVYPGYSTKVERISMPYWQHNKIAEAA